MGISNSAGPERPRAARRSIRFTFAAMVAVPIVCLVVLWGLAVSATLGSRLAWRGFPLRNHRELVEATLVVGAGLVVVLAAVILMGSFARRVSRDISHLAATARHLADEQLPQLVELLRGGEQVTQLDGATPAHRARNSEIAQAAEAIARLQHSAVAAAASEASLRDGLRQVFVSLGRRNQSLLQRQLRLIDALEQKASSPAALADLFSLDHLTTRMRRHAESLTILSGATPGRSWSNPVPIIDVIRGAVAEIEDYQRVTVLTRTEDAVTGLAVADMIHLLAELVENATLFSPSSTRVEVRAERVANGFAIEIDDRGLGIEPDQLVAINQQLARPPDFDLANADQLGLFVGGRLAARHGIRVSLRPSPYGGTTAIVLMPASIVVAAAETSPAETGDDARPNARAAIGMPARLDPRSADALVLTGRRAAQPPLLAASRPEAAPDGLTSTGQPSASQPGPSQPSAGTYRGLPRRTRQANLSPHLRDSPPAAARPSGASPLAAPSSARAPEQARDLAASLQSGWQRGRRAGTPDVQADTPDVWTGTPDAEPAARTRVAGPQDSEVSQSEEALWMSRAEQGQGGTWPGCSTTSPTVWTISGAP